jgi:CheY-like chemotaxis protein
MSVIPKNTSICLADFKSYAKSKNLLIIEDENISGKIIEVSFKDFFNKTIVAHDGQEALEVFKKEKVDIVITDLHMPVMTGTEFMKRIRKVSNVPIIILSGTEDKNELIKLINMGVSRFVEKPFNFDGMAKILLDILEEQKYKELIKEEGCRVCKLAVADDTTKEFEEDILLRFKNFGRKNEDILKKHNLEKFIQKPKDINTIYSLATSLIDVLSSVENNQISTKVEKTQIQSQEIQVAQREKHHLSSLKDVSALDLYNNLKLLYSEPKIRNIYKMIYQESLIAENLLEDLLVYFQNLDAYIGFDQAEEIIENLSKTFLSMYYDALDIIELKAFSNTFYDFGEFFGAFKNLDDLSSNERDALLDIEYLLRDLIKMVKSVFKDLSAENVYTYQNVLESNLNQLETNIETADETNSEDDDIDDIMFFSNK